jgi:hypothetical protein
MSSCNPVLSRVTKISQAPVQTQNPERAGDNADADAYGGIALLQTPHCLQVDHHACGYVLHGQVGLL